MQHSDSALTPAGPQRLCWRDPPRPRKSSTAGASSSSSPALPEEFSDVGFRRGLFDFHQTLDTVIQCVVISAQMFDALCVIFDLLLSTDDEIFERLETTKKHGLLSDYLVSWSGRAGRLSAKVTVWGNDGTPEDVVERGKASSYTSRYLKTCLP